MQSGFNNHWRIHGSDDDDVTEDDKRKDDETADNYETVDNDDEVRLSIVLQQQTHIETSNL